MYWCSPGVAMRTSRTFVRTWVKRRPSGLGALLAPGRTGRPAALADDLGRAGGDVDRAEAVIRAVEDLVDELLLGGGGVSGGSGHVDQIESAGLVIRRGAVGSLCREPGQVEL